jgi:hypothetical protein
MRKSKRWVAFFLLLLPAYACSAAETRDFLLKTLGPASEQRGDRILYRLPRTDLNLLIAGTPLEPGMGLENRFEFQPGEKTARLRGRLLLMDAEIPKILDLLGRRHWKVGGLSHCLLGESPAVKFLQFEAEGSSSNLAEGIRELLSSLGQALPVATPALPAAPDAVFQKQADSLLGQGEWKGRVFCLTLEAPGNTLNPGATGDNPPVSGDFYLQKTTEGALAIGNLVLPPDEAEGLFQTLSANHLELTSWVREPAGEGPARIRLIFLGKGSLEELAKGLNALRDQWKSLSK